MTERDKPGHAPEGVSPLFQHSESEESIQTSQFRDSELVSMMGEGSNEVSPDDLAGRMGQAFVNAKKLTQDEVVRIVRLQRRKRIRFGEAAIRMGLLTEEDVHEVLARQFNYQTIAKHSGGSQRKISSRLLISHSPYSAEAEAIRRFRSEILLRAGEPDCLVITLVSPNSREGKSHLAASLAIAFAQLNLKTLLIDANLRKPSQHQFFDLSNKTGLSTMLVGRTLPTLDLSHTVTDHLNVITAGPKPPNPSEILSQPALSELLDKFRPDVKVIIIDTPPTRVGPDAQIIAPQAGNVIMVCRRDSTSITALHKAYRDMETTSVRILGSFFNTVPTTAGMSVGVLRRWLGRMGRSSDSE
jgi:chain length determinant protein tyrosine kinase EpsG